MIWITTAAAYLVGGLPFGYWWVRWRRGLDLRRVGSRNPGATNALRVAGPWNGFATLVLDVLKGVVAVAGARTLGVPEGELGIVALAAVLGHSFPIWLRFDGGKGVATAAGAYLLLAPGPLAVALAVFLVVLGAVRVVALGSIAAAIAVPAAMWASDRWSEPPGSFEALLGWSAAIAVLVVARHRPNLRRLWARWSSRPREQEET